jgi:predicted lipoprotein with Yx(FWY)xxD motif
MHGGYGIAHVRRVWSPSHDHNIRTAARAVLVCDSTKRGRKLMRLDNPHGSRRRRTRLAGIVMAIAAALAVAAAASHASAAGSGAQVKVAQTSLGRILVDANNHTLYMFAIDKNGKSACYGSCATYWPALVTRNTHVVGSGVKQSLLGTTMRKDGKRQITFDHHPLYRYVADTKAGQIKGQGLNVSGGLWWVLSPSGSPIKKTASAATTTTTTTPSAGGGYGGGYGP